MQRCKIAYAGAHVAICRAAAARGGLVKFRGCNAQLSIGPQQQPVDRIVDVALACCGFSSARLTWKNPCEQTNRQTTKCRTCTPCWTENLSAHLHVVGPTNGCWLWLRLCAETAAEEAAEEAAEATTASTTTATATATAMTGFHRLSPPFDFCEVRVCLPSIAWDV